MKVLNSIVWRYRLWSWGDTLHVGSKRVRRTLMLDKGSKRTIALGRYEKPERELLGQMQKQGLLGRGDIVVEAGGGLGVVAMMIADVIGDDAVFVFEAHPETAAALRENLELNGHKIQVTAAALTAVDAPEVEFSVGHYFYARSTHRTSDRVIRVPAESISSVIKRLDPTILVLDVEGAEADLLCSLNDFGRVRAIHLEVHSKLLSPERQGAMLDNLNKHGFRRQFTGSPIELFVRLTGDTGSKSG